MGFLSLVVSRRLATALLPAATILAGCASLQNPPDTANPAPQIIASACHGDIAVPYGLTEVTDPGLLDKAVQPPGKGGLCKAKVFKVDQPLAVYRVWDATYAKSEFGRWWSFTPPAGPVDTYRAANAICPAWSALNRVTQCRLQAGSTIVIGPGQSAQCPGGEAYSQSPINQVYVPDAAGGASGSKPAVGDCLEYAKWP